jgi:hypothetical protein
LSSYIDVALDPRDSVNQELSAPENERASWAWGARITVGYLYGGLVLGIGLGLLIGSPTTHFPAVLRIAVSAIIALGAMILSSAGWGRAIARKLAVENTRRLARTTALGFAISIIVAGAALNLLEPLAIRGGVLPIHIAYATLFVPAAFVVGAGTTAALAAGLRIDNANGRSVAITVGLCTAAAFLVTYLVMDLAGWRVGAPDAAKRATMLVVTALGALAASLAGGSALGARLG